VYDDEFFSLPLPPSAKDTGKTETWRVLTHPRGTLGGPHPTVTRLSPTRYTLTLTSMHGIACSPTPSMCVASAAASSSSAAARRSHGTVSTPNSHHGPVSRAPAPPSAPACRRRDAAGVGAGVVTRRGRVVAAASPAHDKSAAAHAVERNPETAS